MLTEYDGESGDHKTDYKINYENLKSSNKIVLAFLGREGNGKSQLKSCLTKLMNKGDTTKQPDFKTSVIPSQRGEFIFDIIDLPGFDPSKKHLKHTMIDMFRESRRINAIFCFYSANRFDINKDRMLKIQFEEVQLKFPNNTFYIITSCPKERIEDIKTWPEYKAIGFRKNDKIIFIDNPNADMYKSRSELYKELLKLVEESFHEVFKQVEFLQPVLSDSYLDENSCIIQ